MRVKFFMFSGKKQINKNIIDLVSAIKENSNINNEYINNNLQKQPSVTKLLHAQLCTFNIYFLI